MPFPAAIRRLLLAAAPLAAGVLTAAGAQAKTPVVTILGDSLTAGYGLKAADAIPAQLQARLKAQGVQVQVRAAGVSGDTSADGLARADFSIKPDTDLAVVMLGGNDLLQGVDPKVTRANLTAIVRKMKARRIPVLLVGVKAPPAMGQGYARDFDAVVPAVAKSEAVRAYPDLLGKVALDRALNQGDGVHPNPNGVKIVVQGLAVAVSSALKSIAH